MFEHHKEGYYVPHGSHWPIVGSIALFCMVLGAVNWIHGKVFGPYLLLAGGVTLAYMLFGWFGEVIRESHAGYFNSQVDRSFRWGMAWFIFSEVMFFGAFFGALFYARHVIVPWLGGNTDGVLTNVLLWPNFKAVWPMLISPDPAKFASIHDVIGAWGIPALNTLILLSSGGTITWAHWGLIKNNRSQLNIAMFFTIILGVTFLLLQAYEYHEAYSEYGLKLSSGIYGTTFFMLTGFHGLHVTIGTIMLISIFGRCLRGHFNPNSHFAFEAVAWYWHFVDVVWLFLFIFVYWL